MISDSQSPYHCDALDARDGCRGVFGSGGDRWDHHVIALAKLVSVERVFGDPFPQALA
jgi:hypothetical protein